MKCAVAVLALSALGAAQTLKDDVQLQAMQDELARAKTLQLNNLDKPYFIQYTASDADELLITASLGGILSSIRERGRNPRAEIRVGSPDFDNSNSLYSAGPLGGSLPIDDNYDALRTAFWLDSDAEYKAASDQITRKRNALREIADADKTPDLAPATATKEIDPPSSFKVDQQQWENLARRVSAKFTAAPSVTESSVRFRSISSTYRLVNSEGSVIRIPQELTDFAVLGEARAADGSRVWEYQAAVGLTPHDLPNGEALEKMAEGVAGDLEDLAKAPVSEDYSGPVLFDGESAAQMLGAALADALRLQRKPLAPPGANTGQLLESVWSAKLGAKVLPEWMSIIDDPLQEKFHGTALSGAYKVDDEGVPAQRVVLVDKGVLKNFLASREPVKSIDASNGHGRLPGAWGTELPVAGNLFVEAKETTPESEMKAKLIEKAKAAGLKFGLLIRRLDFPSAADGEELQSMGRQLQKGGVSRTLNSPILIYRVYLDGHEELVRGLRFKDFSAKDLRDVSLASDQPHVFNYVNNGSGFNHADAGASATSTAVIAPSLLFDSLELAKAETEPGKLPIVPAPAFVAEP